MAGNIRSGSVPAGTTEMEYATFGSGDRNLIVLPGLSDGLATVKGKALLLAKPYLPVLGDFTVTMFSRINDMPEGYSIRDMAEDQWKVLDAMGFAVFIVDPLDLTAMNETIDRAIELRKEGKFPAIITRRPCVLLKRMPTPKKLCRVDPEKCRSCKMCLACGCPAIALKDGKAHVDPGQCIGCTVCAQICPFGAIS